MTGVPEEVDAGEFIDRGINIEVADLEVDGEKYVSLAFEGFPDDSAMDAAFTHVVEIFLAALEGVDLKAADSMGYPAWLASLRDRASHQNP
jgi:hypothetical protein